MPVLYFLVIAFQIWMLVDAAKRRADVFWYFIILVPLGAVVYFFMVKIHDYDFKWLKTIFIPRPSVGQLRYQLRQNPCIENKILLAKALYADKQYGEAVDLLEQVLKYDPTDREAIYCMGHCKSEQKDYPQAEIYFKKLIELEKSYQDYAAWLDLASVYWNLGKREETILLLRELVKTSPRINHETMLAYYLIQMKKDDEAYQILTTALEDYKYAPHFVKRQNQIWAFKARYLLRSLKHKN